MPPKHTAPPKEPKVLDSERGYVDDADYENGHVPVADAIARSRAGLAALARASKPPTEGAEFPLALIADQDQGSRIDAKGGQWASRLALASLRYKGDRGEASYELELKGAPSDLITERGDKSARGAEYSVLDVFDGRLLTCCDRTGLVEEVVVDPGTRRLMVTPLRAGGRDDGEPVMLLLGDGSTKKPLKAEWSTQRGGRLVIGSTGKERTDDSGSVVHHGEMWVKAIAPGTYEVESVDGTPTFNALRAAAGVGSAPPAGGASTGYAIHEAGRWSEAHQRWFFMPRKLSREPYDEEIDTAKCCNLAMVCPDAGPDGESDVDAAARPFPGGAGPAEVNVLLAPLLGFKPLRGTSDFIFVPGTNDGHILIIRTEETLEGSCDTHAAVVDLTGNVLMAGHLVEAGAKYEGVCWTKGWAGLEALEAGLAPAGA